MKVRNHPFVCIILSKFCIRYMRTLPNAVITYSCRNHLTFDLLKAYKIPGKGCEILHMLRRVYYDPYRIIQYLRR